MPQYVPTLEEFARMLYMKVIYDTPEYAMEVTSVHDFDMVIEVQDREGEVVKSFDVKLSEHSA